jgi:hypothetical protein
MGDFLWVLPALVCGGMMVMMLVMMLGMGKSMFSRNKEDEEKPSLEQVRAENERLAGRVDELERGASEKEHEPTAGGA